MNRLKSYYIIVLLSLSFVYTQDNVDIVTKVATSAANWLKLETGTRAIGMGGAYTCLLYTSDAADAGLGVELGGRRIIIKKGCITPLFNYYELVSTYPCLLYTSPSPRD